MTITREFIRDLENFTGSAKLWRVSPAIEYVDGHGKAATEYVVSSATVAMFSGPETYLFPADESGEVLSWGELPGSFRGALDHEMAMNGLGSDWE